MVHAHVATTGALDAATVLAPISLATSSPVFGGVVLDVLLAPPPDKPIKLNPDNLVTEDPSLSLAAFGQNHLLAAVALETQPPRFGRVILDLFKRAKHLTRT